MPESCCQSREGQEELHHEQFVSEALIPYISRFKDGSMDAPRLLASLIWGYSSAVGSNLSPLEIGRVIRRHIWQTEESDVGQQSDIRALLRALRILHDAIPEVVARYPVFRADETSSTS